MSSTWSLPNSVSTKPASALAKEKATQANNMTKRQRIAVSSAVKDETESTRYIWSAAIPVIAIVDKMMKGRGARQMPMAAPVRAEFSNRPRADFAPA